MLKFNENYSINDGEGSIIFSEGKKGTVNATYEIKGKKDTGTINGTLDGNVLKGTYHNKIGNSTGLIEFIFNENGFDAKWKSGLEPGPMRGKWEGALKAETRKEEKIKVDIASEALTDEQKKYLEEGVSSWDFEGEDEQANIKKGWLSNRAFLIQALKQNGRCIQYAPNDMKSDRGIVLEAVKNDGRALEYAADAIKADREIVLEAVKNYGRVLEYAADAIKADREIVLEAVKNYGRVLEYASDAIKADQKIVQEAIKNDGTSLEFASDSIKADREIVLEAVKNDGRVLEYANESIKADRHIVLEAIKNYNRSIAHACDELHEDSELVLEALKKDSYVLHDIRSENILREIAEKSSVSGKKINFKVRDLVEGAQKLFEKKLWNENGDLKDEFESICNDWFDFNQIIYQNQKMDGDALLSLAQVQFWKFRPVPTDERDVETYTKDLLIEAIELQDDSLYDIIKYGLRPEEYLDFSDLAEKACERLWNKNEKNYVNGLMVLQSDDNGELIPGLSNEFIMKVIQEVRDLDSGDESEKEAFESFVSDEGLE